MAVCQPVARPVRNDDVPFVLDQDETRAIPLGRRVYPAVRVRGRQHEEGGLRDEVDGELIQPRLVLLGQPGDFLPYDGAQVGFGFYRMHGGSPG